MAHQAAKLPPNKRDDFLTWEYELEYRVNKIPKENLVIYLHLPAAVAQELLIKRGRRDSHEKKVEFLTASQIMYKKLSKKYKHWVKIDCVDKNGILLPRETIHKKILANLRRNKILR